MQYIGDTKSGRLVGTDQFGNRYYENMNPREEVPGTLSFGSFFDVYGAHMLCALAVVTAGLIMHSDTRLG